MKQQLDRERYHLLHTMMRLMEGPMVFLGFVWLVLLIVEFIWGLTPPLEQLTLSIWVVFILDFLVKLIIAPKKNLF